MSLRIPQFWSQILLLWSALAGASTELFDDTEPLLVELRGPLSETIVDRTSRDERPFKLSIGEQSVAVDVRVRGKSRAERCRFPPLRLNFSDNDASGTVFAGQGALKLVTPCKDNDAYEQYILEEYAAYRMFALLSDVAFRTRLLRIRFVDEEREDRSSERYAFVIEPEELLAARINGTSLEAGYIPARLLNRAQAAMVFVFQFMIGNTDWSLAAATGEDLCCHNGRLVGIDGEYYYVPYDFDQAGIVSARYAKPHPGLGLRTVKTRRYRGNCVSGLDLEDAVRAARDLEGPIRELLAGLPGSNEKLDQGRQRYMDEFFDAARDPAELAADFERRCLD